MLEKKGKGIIKSISSASIQLVSIFFSSSNKHYVLQGKVRSPPLDKLSIFLFSDRDYLKPRGHGLITF